MNLQGERKLSMLVRFTVGNFRSFNKNQTLSLIAGSIQNHKERLYQLDDFKLLKFGVIFGANAAGKSNFISAIDYAQTLALIKTDHPYFEYTKYNYHRLNPLNKEKTSYFEFEICIDGSVYAYGFEVLIYQKKITEEWLIKLNKDKDIQIYYRNTITGAFSFNEDYINPEYISRMQVYFEDFKHVTNQSFLSEIISNKAELYNNNPQLEILKKLHDWIKNLNISTPETAITGYDCFSTKNIDDLLKAIQTFNTGISKVIPNEISKEQALEQTSEKIRKEIEDDIAKACPDQCNEPEGTCVKCGFRMRINGKLIFVTFKNRQPIFTEITFEHFGIENVRFSLAEESDGTQRLLDLLSVLFTQKENSVFIIDEIDRSLHPLLNYRFVENFLQIATKRNIQLIITSHESHLLNLRLLRQDEIFFTEVTKTGESTLFPFDRFKERFDKKIEKAYLDGRYGGVPLFDTFFFPPAPDTQTDTD